MLDGFCHTIESTVDDLRAELAHHRDGEAKVKVSLVEPFLDKMQGLSPAGRGDRRGSPLPSPCLSPLPAPRGALGRASTALSYLAGTGWEAEDRVWQEQLSAIEVVCMRHLL